MRSTSAPQLRWLGLHLRPDGSEAYAVSFQVARDAGWEPGELRHRGESSWDLVDAGHTLRATLPLGLPDEVFATASGSPAPRRAIDLAVPYWPAGLRDRLARRQATGPCTIAFDADWFLHQLTTTAIDHPLLLLDATATLGLDGLARATEALAAGPTDLIDLLQQGLAADRDASWGGEGRLIGESTWGDLVQAGSDITEGCEAARGTGRLEVTFPADQPMGVGFGPAVPSPEVIAGHDLLPDASAGTGLEVGMVDPDSVADEAGLRPGMVATALAGRDLSGDGSPLAFEALLADLDARRDAGEAVPMAFDSAAPLTHWYAVEMPAASALTALANAPLDLGLGPTFTALCGPDLLWREPIPRLFVGGPGSVTCAHIDICPQVQLAHGLLGDKVLGVATHAATPRLRAQHCAADDDDDIDGQATYVPTDRPLSPAQAGLLADPDVSLLWLRPGDLLVLHSGAMHFASNGARGLGAAVYHGLISAGSLPRLRLAAAAPGGSGEQQGTYAGHLHAADLLRLVQALPSADST